MERQSLRRQRPLGQIPFTGSLQRVVFGANLGELRREALLSELPQRVRDFAQGPDGNIYVLADGNENAVLRIEPTAPSRGGCPRPSLET